MQSVAFLRVLCLASQHGGPAAPPVASVARGATEPHYVISGIISTMTEIIVIIVVTHTAFCVDNLANSRKAKKVIYTNQKLIRSTSPSNFARMPEEGIQ